MLSVKFWTEFPQTDRDHFMLLVVFRKLLYDNPYAIQFRSLLFSTSSEQNI